MYLPPADCKATIKLPHPHGAAQLMRGSHAGLKSAQPRKPKFQTATELTNLHIRVWGFGNRSMVVASAV